MTCATLTTDTISFEDWLSRLDSWRVETRELVRLWFVNDFGSQRELAKHLDISKGTVSYHVKALRSIGQLPEAEEPERAKTAHPVEKPNGEQKRTPPVENLPVVASTAVNANIRKQFIPEEQLPPGIVIASVDANQECLQIQSVLSQILDAITAEFNQPQSSWCPGEWRAVHELACHLHYQTERAVAVHGGPVPSWEKGWKPHA